MLNAGLYWRTLRHLKFSQMARRAHFIMRKKAHLYPHPPLPKTTPAFEPRTLGALEQSMTQFARHAPTDPEMLDELREGRLTFLHHTESCGKKFPWQRHDLPRLWRYHLHYFDYAKDLALATLIRRKAGDRDWMLSIIQDWITNNPPGTSIAWDAYPIASRLINWSIAESAFHFNDPLMKKSFQQQALYLARSLEYDVRANHLLREAAALVLADALLGGKHRASHVRLLETQVNEQILSDGGHYERSLLYHCQALQDLLIVYAALPSKPAWLREALARMADFLQTMLHPDGDIPLFGDAALGQYSPRALLRLTRGLIKVPGNPLEQGCCALLPSGYYIFVDENTASRMTIKAGIPGPPYQLGHAHNDTGSFEFCLGRERVIVDSGVHGYAESPLRSYCRSASAHNIALVNGVEQLECWATFRTGRRMLPPQVTWREHDTMNELVIRYTPCRSIQHERRIVQAKEGFWIISDTAVGANALEMKSFLHIHPDFSLQEIPEGWLLTKNQTRLILLFPAPEVKTSLVHGESAPQQGWYCPQFGLALPNPALVFQTLGTGTVSIRYAIVPFMSEAQRIERIQHAQNWPGSMAE